MNASAGDLINQVLEITLEEKGQELHILRYSLPVPT
jgi:hypothetical protein